MPSSSPNPVYNAPIQDMPISPRLLRIVCVSLFVFPRGPLLSAQNWQAPSEQLARQIAAITGSGTVAVNVVNRSSLGPSDVAEIQRELMADLAGLGVHAGSTTPDAVPVQVSLSENLLNYLWVAEIHAAGKEPTVVMVESARNSVTPQREFLTMTIHKSLLLEIDDRILDVAPIGGTSAGMIVLEPERVTLYSLHDGQWQPQQSLAIEHARPWPRDLRGRLSLRPNQTFDGYLPGVVCHGSVTPLSLNCHEGDDPWPLGPDQFALRASFASSRNFFTGMLLANNQKQSTEVPFFSAAALPQGANILWLSAGIDGQVHLLEGTTDQTMSKANWGSDIATVHSGCGSGWQILASANSDGPSDAVQAFEIVDRRPVAVSRPVEFDGRITALWAESESSSVLAVARNSEASKYEAYRLSITCGQ